MPAAPAAAVVGRLRQSPFLYAHPDTIGESPALSSARAATDDAWLSLVHPVEFMKATDPASMSLRGVLLGYPAVAVGAVRRVCARW